MAAQYRNTFVATLVLCSALTGVGCLERELKPLNPCLVSAVSRRVSVNNIDKVDLLFMVDNSNSMTEEQAALKVQFPKMIQVLTSGMRTANDPNPFPPAKDLHLAVVNSDMGTFGEPNVPGCDVNGAADGRLQHTSNNGAGCAANYPTFLTYLAMRDNPMQIGVDFGCIAELGIGGCGYERQLEAPFKALWPSVYSDAKGALVTPNPYTFVGPITTGRGDLPAPEGAQGFIRSDPTVGLSLVAIIVVTDEEDCSTPNIHIFNTVAGDPVAAQNTQVRCPMNKQSLYETKRYIDGFKALRPGNEKLVVFAAIAGVPPTLVDAQARMNVNFSDDAQRNAYYDRIMNDRAMQEMIVGNSVAPSCQRRDRSGQNATAFPPRRIVEVARGFGENGIIQSICQDDFGGAMDAIIEVIARQLGAVCLPRALVRKSDGVVGCNVVWELPPPKAAPATTPTECSGLPFLKQVDPGRVAVNERGGNNCKVEQLPILGANVIPNAAGWYYDNFSTGVKSECPPNEQQRVAFTASAKPPTGVVVKLECLNETQKLPITRKDISTAAPQPEVGSACKGVVVGGRMLTGDAACVVALTSGQDTSMFCHPDLNVCVKSCKNAVDCPPAWECDDRKTTIMATAGKAYCVNPTCGAD
jgi:hypothetical protein